MVVEESAAGLWNIFLFNNTLCKLSIKSNLHKTNVNNEIGKAQMYVKTGRLV